MWNVATDVERWRAEGAQPVVARCSALSGLSGRRAGEVLALVPGGDERAGGLLGGLADAQVLAAAARIGPGSPIELLDVEVDNDEALRAGLGCGGLARVVVQDAATLPERLWESLRTRTAVALATEIDRRPGATLAVTAAAAEGDLAPAALSEAATGAARELLARGREAVTTVEHDDGTVLVELFVPTTRLVLVGDTEVLTGALRRQAELLGWECEERAELDGALAAVAELGPGDALVVLSHDHDLDTPVLAAALAGPAYVGALGSRRTQERRQERLAAIGVGEEHRARVHGPIGLDLGARVPEETALAICAEILAVRSGRDAARLSSGSGPING